MHKVSPCGGLLKGAAPLYPPKKIFFTAILAYYNIFLIKIAYTVVFYEIILKLKVIYVAINVHTHNTHQLIMK